MRAASPVWRLRSTALRYRFHESLFFFPLLIMTGGIVLAILAPAMDRAWGPGRPMPLSLAMHSNAATWLLATVAGAMITTAGVVLSLTIVSLQLASDQFSPRVMRSFIRDRISQSVIGLLVATFFYCVLILPTLDADPSAPAPPISLTIAVVLTIATVIAIIVHLDHLARRLQVGQVARVIELEGGAVLAALSRTPSGLQPLRDAQVDSPPTAVTVLAPVSGWVSQVDLDGLLAGARPRTTIRIDTRVGAYVHAGEPLLTAWPALSPAGARRLTAAIEIADSRTMIQDVDFAIRQLVDIGLRALSAAVNDPTTAVEVTLRLGSLLRRVLTTRAPAMALVDPQGRLLVRPWDLNHDEYVAHAIDQLRQHCLTQSHVAAALLRVLRMLISHVEQAGCPERAPALRRQVSLLMDALVRTPTLHAADLEWLQAVAGDETDPADHSQQPPS